MSAVTTAMDDHINYWPPSLHTEQHCILTYKPNISFRFQYANLS